MTPADLHATLDRLGWGATALAGLTGYSRQGVQQWLLGRVAVPSAVAAWLRSADAWIQEHPAPRRAA